MSEESKSRIRTLILPCLVLLTFCLIGLSTWMLVMEWERCVRVQYNSPRDEKFYYWRWAHRSVDHGICAAMYTSAGSGDQPADQEGSVWEVDKPDPSGKPTAIYLFNTRKDAENYAESLCWSRDKNWTVVTQ